MKISDIKDKRRLIFGLVSALAGISSVIYICQFLYYNDWFQYIWIISFALMGLGVAAIHASTNTESDGQAFYLQYFLNYPAIILTSTSLTFFFAKSANISSVSLFLIITSLNGLIAGRLVDYLEFK